MGLELRSAETGLPRHAVYPSFAGEIVNFCIKRESNVLEIKSATGMNRLAQAKPCRLLPEIWEMMKPVTATLQLFAYPLLSLK